MKEDIPLKYYTIIEDPIEPNKKQELFLELHESDVLPFLIKHPQISELLFSDRKDIKVSYDKASGEVTIKDIEDSNKDILTVVYGNDAFEKRIDPIEKALSLLAKYDLLSRIDNLISEMDDKHKNNSSIKGLTGLIPKPDALPHQNIHNLIQGVLTKIQGMFKFSLSSLGFNAPQPKPIDAVVHHAIVSYGVERIKSINDVAKIMQEIESTIAEKIPDAIPAKKMPKV